MFVSEIQAKYNLPVLVQRLTSVSLNKSVCCVLMQLLEIISTYASCLVLSPPDTSWQLCVMLLTPAKCPGMTHSCQLVSGAGVRSMTHSCQKLRTPPWHLKVQQVIWNFGKFQDVFVSFSVQVNFVVSMWSSNLCLSLCVWKQLSKVLLCNEKTCCEGIKARQAASQS